jgi:CRISPR-associated protein Cst1
VLNDLLAIYADGFIAPDRARQFVRRHLLSRAASQIERAGDCDWNLTDLFLKEVLGMSPDRIERIRTFADALATYTSSNNDKSCWNAVAYAKRPGDVRVALLKAQRRQAASLLFSFDDYVNVFEAESNLGFTDWSLVRDLICIRMVEQLHKSGWLTPDELKEPEDMKGDQQ